MAHNDDDEAKRGGSERKCGKSTADSLHNTSYSTSIPLYATLDTAFTVNNNDKARIWSAQRSFIAGSELCRQ